MVKKRMAMRMVTIFVALIVCGMFFPDLARGEDQGIDTVLNEGGNTVLDVDVGSVVLGESKITSVGITNQSSDSYTVTLLLNSDAACPNEFTHNAAPIVTNFEPGAVLNVDVMFTPSDLGACSAELQIAYYGSVGGLVEINFTGSGVEEVSETFEPIVIGGFPTHVVDRLIDIDEQTSSTLAEMIDECESTSYRRGDLVRCIAWTTGELKKEGLLEYNEVRELRRTAARVEIQKIIQAMRTRTHSKRGRFWWIHHH
jgi:hypothetical protein